MKKGIILPLIALTIGLGGCNNQPNLPAYHGIGAYTYYGSQSYIENVDGTIFYAAPGTTFLNEPDYDGSPRLLLDFNYDTEYTERGPGKEIPITFSGYYQAVPSFLPGSSFPYDEDPILGIYGEGSEAGIQMIANMLTFAPEHLVYQANAEIDKGFLYTLGYFNLELEETVGPDNIIQTRLEYFADRGKNESVASGTLNFSISLSEYPIRNIAFDFQYVADNLNLNKETEYTIRVNYTAYDWPEGEDFDEEKTVEKQIEIRWTPNEYGRVR